MRILMTILSVMAAVGMMAQDFRATGEFTSDTKGSVARNAEIELSLASNYESLRLLVLPVKDADVADALVDTIWGRGTRYRNEDPVIAEKYQERDIFYFYNFDSEDRLTGYFVFSRFVDTTRAGVMQIVARRFAPDGKRLWCMTVNADDAQAKTFFDILTQARKKMKFKKATTMRGGEKQRPDFQDYKIHNSGSTIGRGSAYGTGW